MPAVTNIENNYWSNSSISVDDIYKAMETVRSTGSPKTIATKSGIVYDTIQPASIESIRDSYGLPKIGASNVASTEFGNKIYAPSSYSDSLDVDFDEAVWRIYMPGVSKEDVQVFTVSDIVHVDVSNGLPRKTFKLADGETVKSTKLDLGVLTITIDRPNKRQSIKVS